MNWKSAAYIHLCGLGTRPPRETALETLRILAECRVVFSDVADRKTRRWLNGYCRLLKNASGPRAIVARARREAGPVGVAVWGHPQLTSRLARGVRESARKAGIPVAIHAAVSPISSALARLEGFLGDDCGHAGISAYALETLLRSARLPDPEMPLVVFSEPGPRPRWREGVRRLRRLYPKASLARNPSSAGGEMLLVSPSPNASR